MPIPVSEKINIPGNTTKTDLVLWSLRDIQQSCWQEAENHGWHEPKAGQPPTTFGDRIALIHSEASEALEEFRDGHGYNEVYYRPSDGKPEGVPTELADIMIRVWDLAEIHGIDLAAAILEKHQFNATRPFRHGNKEL